LIRNDPSDPKSIRLDKLCRIGLVFGFFLRDLPSKNGHDTSLLDIGVVPKS
jgi:hypothetical protein